MTDQPQNKAELVELHRKLGENDLSGDVIVSILHRSSCDDLPGAVA